MSPAALIDTNIPLYAGGSPHPLREPCARILLLVAEHPDTFVTNAEVLQELLHRYLALRRWREGRRVFMGFAELMREHVEPVQARDVERAAILANTFPELGGRDLLHAAVMQRLGVHQIVTADAGFDRMPDIERLDPAQFERWRDMILE